MYVTLAGYHLLHDDEAYDERNMEYGMRSLLDRFRVNIRTCTLVVWNDDRICKLQYCLRRCNVYDGWESHMVGSSYGVCVYVCVSHLDLKPEKESEN